jgi:hypothetical protein
MHAHVALGRQRQEDYKFKASLGYIVNSRLAELHSKTLSLKKTLLLYIATCHYLPL